MYVRRNTRNEHKHVHKTNMMMMMLMMMMTVTMKINDFNNLSDNSKTQNDQKPQKNRTPGKGH